MYANIVLAGGGVKGAVLGGCLKAAEDKGIRPVGFGGTSAGSIVAALASVGYTGAELRQILVDKTLTDFLDDGGARLSELKKASAKLFRRLQERSVLSVLAISPVAKFFKNQYGLYSGNRLKAFLAEAIAAKVDNLPVPAEQVTFKQLRACGCSPLRVVATDLNLSRAVIFGTERQGANESVVEAVLASASFPFVFHPVSLGGMLLADGGLSSNLPAFLFEKEYRETRTPTLAFDLILPSKPNPFGNEAIDLIAFAQSLLGSALEASDVLLREGTPGVTYFPIETPEGIGTLDFSLTAAHRESCFSKGYAEAATQLEQYEAIKRTRMFGGELQKRLIATFGPPRLYEPVLRAVIQQLELASTGEIRKGRAHIMLLTGRASERVASTRIVTYAVGMDRDADSDLELDQDGGCSGKAWESGTAAVADLEAASANPLPWKMTVEQHNKVPRRMKSMISVPIPGNVHAEEAPERPIGTLSVDCETPLADTGWCTDAHRAAELGPDAPLDVVPNVLTVMSAWATVIGAMLP